MHSTKLASIGERSPPYLEHEVLDVVVDQSESMRIAIITALTGCTISFVASFGMRDILNQRPTYSVADGERIFGELSQRPFVILAMSVGTLLYAIGLFLIIRNKQRGLGWMLCAFLSYIGLVVVLFLKPKAEHERT